ncbi:MAG: winged helix-turn-helix domain-containing protein [Vicinamibacterales bacterium]
MIDHPERRHADGIHAVPRTGALRLAVGGTVLVFDPGAREIVGPDGRRTRLAAKPSLVLQALVDRAGEVVTRDALRRILWPDGTWVDFDNNLNSAVATVRQALGDSARDARCLETIPKVGYRLLASVVPVVPPPVAEPPAAPEAGAAAAAPPRARWRGYPRAWSAAVAVAVLLAGAAWWSRGPQAPPAASSPVPAARAAFERGLYLRGRARARHDDAAALADARDAFHAAVLADAGFADAFAEEADTLVDMSFAGGRPFVQGMREARVAAGRALALDPGNKVAARVTGTTTLFLEWDFAAARQWLDRSAASGEDARTAMAMATWLAAAGDAAGAVEAAERAVALDPAAWYVRADLAMFYLAADRPADAAESARQVLQVEPAFAPAHAYALIACERQGRLSDAADHARALLRASGAGMEDVTRITGLDDLGAVAAWRAWDLARLERAAEGRRADYALPLALRLAAAGDHAGAITALRDALDHGQALLVFLRAYPELAGLHGRPDFEALVRQVAAGRPGTEPPSTE